MANLSAFVPDLKKASDKRHDEIAGKPVKPVEKGGRPVFSSGEIPKVFTPDDPARPPHLKNWERLSPGSQRWTNVLPGIPDSPAAQFIQGAAETAMGLPVIGGFFRWFQALADTVEQVLGYTYQAAFDEQLRSSDAIGFMLKQGGDPVFKDPDAVAGDIGGYDPLEQKVIGAWWAGQQAYETTRFGLLPLIEDFRALAKGAAAAGPLGAVGLFGEDLQEVGRIIRVKALDSFKGIHLGDDGITLGDYKPLTDAEKEALRQFDMEWIFDELDSDSYVEKQRQRAENQQNFLEGNHFGEYYGLPELVTMRQKVISGEDPAQVQADYAERLGALWVDAQMDNLWGQVLIDPLCLFTFTPIVEGAKFLRSTALTGRTAPAIFNKVDDVVRMAEGFDDLGDATKVDDYLDAANDFVRVAEELGIDDVTNVAKKVQGLVVEGAPADDILKAMDDVKPFLQDASELKKMSRVERFAVALTGGDPFNPAKFWGKGIAGRLNPFSLSAQARADELINMLHNSLSPLLREAATYEDMVRIIKQGAAGAFGGRLGHMFVSPMGKYVQRILKEMARNADELGEVVIKTTPQRQLAEAIGKVLGTDSVDVIKIAGQGEKESRALFAAFEKALARIDDGVAIELLRQAVEEGELTWKRLSDLGELFKPTTDGKIIPFTPDMMRGAIMKNAVDAAVAMGIQEFGVKEATMLQQAVQYVKSAESLVFLGFNPFYPVQNFYNGEITSFLRGTWGFFMPERFIPKALRGKVATAEDLWKRAKMDPARLHEGFGIAGPEYWDELARSAATAEEAALVGGRKALRSTVWPTPEGIGGWFMDKTRKIKGFRGLAAATERVQSERIITEVYPRAMRTLKRAYSRVDDVVPGMADELRTHDAKLADYLEDAVRAAQNSDEILDVAKAGNVNLNLETLLRNTAESMGFDVQRMSRFVGEEVHETVRRTMENLGKNPTEDAIRTAFRDIEDYVQVYLDEMLAANIPTMTAEAAAKVEAEGANAVLQLLGEVSDSTFSRHAANMRYLDTSIEGILRIQDPVLSNRAWKAVLETANFHWTRQWKWENAMRKGVQAGLKKRGISTPKNFMRSFDELRSGSQTFTKLRNKLWRDFFDALKEGKFPEELDRIEAATLIYERLDKEYIKLIDLTEASRKQMDGVFMMMLPENAPAELKTAVSGWRELVRRQARRDMENVLDFRQSIRGLDPEEKFIEWRAFDEARMADHQGISQLEELGRAAVNGDEQAMAFFAEQAQRMGVGPEDVRIGEQFNVRAIDGEQWRVIRPGEAFPPGREFNLGLGEGGERLVKMTPEEIADDAERLVREAEIAQAIVDAPGAPVLPEFDRVVGRQMYIGTGLDQLWFDDGSRILNRMQDEAVKLVNEPTRRVADLPPDLQSKVQRYLDHMVGEFRETRFAAVRVSEGMRDASLLNYSRTYNFDNWLATLLPFHFWYTHSIGRWALHSLDRPWILANYAKTKNFLDNVMGQNEAFPQRLRGHVKMDMPFAPEEAGGVWVNPFRAIGLPFASFTQPFERWQQNSVSVENRTERRLEEMLEAGDISEVEYQTALEQREGLTWDRAEALVRDDEDAQTFDLMDFMNLSISPHLPISAAYQLARGTPEELNPLPHTRSLKHIATILGVDPGIYDNVWGNVRKAVGLPAFDQYDEYRVDRQMSNFSGMEGKVIDGKPVTLEDILLAMATREGPIYEAARQTTADIEAFRYVSRFFGIPANPYPEGEEKLRSLYDEFDFAMELKDKGDDRALGRFFDENPEFETRLALWDEPEERLQQFYIDQIWNWYWDAPKLNRDEAVEQFGPMFERGFVNGDTRAPEAIPLNILNTWVHLLGGTAPGQLSLDQGIAPIEFTDPVAANRLQAYYNTRQQTFLYSEQVWPLWQTYFRLDEGPARRKFWNEHPILGTYTDWREDFMIRNPDLIPYIEDDPEKQPTFKSEEALIATQEAQPNLTPLEWQRFLGPEAYNLTLDFMEGENMPLVARNRLDETAAELGLGDWTDVVGQFAESHGHSSGAALPAGSGGGRPRGLVPRPPQEFGGASEVGEASGQ